MCSQCNGLLAVSVALLCGALTASPVCAQAVPKPVPGLGKINHIIVIYLENRSFDNLYGLFPGANGIANAGAAATQVDKDGKPYEKLPPVLNTNYKPPAVDARFPAGLANGPFRAEQYANIEQVTGDSWHRLTPRRLS
jgi:phospholipase C